MTAPTIAAVRILRHRWPLPKPRVFAFGLRSHRDALTVEIETADGVRGWGEVWSQFPPWGPVERVEILRHAIRPLLVGETLDDPARLYRLMMTQLRTMVTQWGARGPVHQAIAGADIALWDAHARTRGQPLKDLLAGAPAPDRVPVYGSNIGPDAVAEMIPSARASGHRRFKSKVSGDPDADRATLEAGRAAAGGASFMVDGNQRLTPDTLKGIAGLLMDAGLDWLEEPFPVDDAAAYAGWPHGLDGVPLALGENEQGADGLARMIAAYGPRVVQPDLTKTLGVTEGMTVGRQVVADGRRLCFHMNGGPFGLYASAHVAAAIAGSDWVEMDCNPNPLFDDLSDAPPRVEDGDLLLPGGPGLGASIPEPVRAEGLRDGDAG